MIRLLSSLVLILGVLLAPWWVVLPMTALGLFVFNYYAEAIAVALLGDILFGASTVGVGVPWQAVFMLVLFLVVQTLKSRLRFYEVRQSS